MQPNEAVFLSDPWRKLRAEFSFAALKKESWRMLAVALLVSGIAYYRDGRYCPSGLPSWSLGPLLVLCSCLFGMILRVILICGIYFFSKLIVSDAGLEIKEPGRRIVKLVWGEVQAARVDLKDEYTTFIQIKPTTGGRNLCAMINTDDLPHFRQLIVMYAGNNHPLVRAINNGDSTLDKDV